MTAKRRPIHSWPAPGRLATGKAGTSDRLARQIGQMGPRSDAPELTMSADRDRGRRHQASRRCLGTFVDLLGAPSYQLLDALLVRPDLADRPDPERQGRSAEIPHQVAESRGRRRARLSIHSAAVQVKAARSPSLPVRRRARTAPPSAPAIASALARQRFPDRPRSHRAGDATPVRLRVPTADAPKPTAVPAPLAARQGGGR